MLFRSPTRVHKPGHVPEVLVAGSVSEGRRFAVLRDKAAAARDAIDEMIRELEQELSGHQRKPGRPKDSMHRDFAVEIARAFYHCLNHPHFLSGEMSADKPASYREVTPTSTEGGPFCKVLELCFQAVGMELKDAHSLAVDALKY